MGDLAAFIAARLNDEEPSKVCGCLDVNHWPPCTPQPWRERKCREIEAKRRLIGRFRAALAARKDEYDAALAALYGQMCDEAAVWNDHPDYREHWSPLGSPPDRV